MTEAMVDERELAFDIGDELEDHATARGDVERLYALDEVPRRRAEIHLLELLADGDRHADREDGAGQASIQGETVRVSGKDRDTLQDVIAKLKAKDFGIDMTFDNYRSN